MIPFTLYKFIAEGHQVQLVLPEVWQADEFFNRLQENLAEFSKWLVWAKSIDSVEKEANSIKTFQQKMVDGIAFNLVILVDGVPAGMLDLHEMNKKSGEVGYWLAKSYQHFGIMTKSVNFLIEYAFSQLKLEYLILRTAPDNFASQSVAKRCGFSYVEIDENEHKVFRLEKELRK